VIQYESMLAQARSTEVAAKSSYGKARVALQRGDRKHSGGQPESRLDAAVKGKM